jgi:hypothetical protein
VRVYGTSLGAGHPDYLRTRVTNNSDAALVARPDGSALPATGVSFATISLMAAAVLVYVSGSFLVAEVYGIKRFLEIILIVPIAIAALRYLISRPGRLFEPLSCFVIIKTVTEVVLRGQWLYVLDDFAALLALTAVFAAPAENVAAGAKLVVRLAGLLAVMALVQWFVLFFDPALGGYSLIVSEEAVIQNTVKHPIALLGLFGELQFSFLGHDVARLQSFAMEPSLNVVYFLLPASLAFLVDSKSSRVLGILILTFCVLSFSGSVYLALAFSAVWWLLLWVFTIRFVMLYGVLLALVAYLFVLDRVGFDPLLEGIAYLAQYGDFLAKNVSVTDRGISALANTDIALVSPLGSTMRSDLAGPWLVNAALEAGWLGVLFLLVFLRKLGGQLEVLKTHCGPLSAKRFGSLLLLGALSVIVVFNDYQMSNYAGLVLLGFIYRTVQVGNELAGSVRPSATSPRL